MAQPNYINIGSAPNDGLGDSIRTSFGLSNAWFSFLNSRVQSSPPATLVGNIGDEAGMYAYDSVYFYYCFANYDGSSVIWAQVTQVGNIAITSLNNGASNIVVGLDGDATVNINGTSNVAAFRSTGTYVTGVVSATGNITGSYIIGNGSQLTGLPASYSNANVDAYLPVYSGNISAGNISITSAVTSNTVVATGNVAGGNLTTNGQVSATGNIVTDQYFVGNFFGNITGNFVVPGSNTQVIYNTNGNADAVAGFTFDTAGPNLLTVLGTISSQGNIIAGNVRTAGQISAAGNIIAGNISVTQIAGTLSTAAQPSITSLGSLSSLIVIGNITGGNIATSGTVSAAGNIAGGNLSITEVNAGGNISASNYTGLVVSATGNITGGNLRTGGQVSATANITGGNIATSGQVSAAGNVTGNYIFGNGVSLTGVISSYGDSNVATLLSTFGSNTISTTGSINSGNITGGNLATSGTVSSAGNITGGNITTGGTINSTSTINGGNLVTSGTVSATGNVSGGNLITTGALVVNSNNAPTAIVNGGGNAIGNIGSSTTYFNTVFAKATSAQYADLAECYTADAEYAPGTILCFDGTAEVTQCNTDACPTVVGVVSTNPAYKMNSGLIAEHIAVVALTGRVPTKVKGPVRKGAMMVSAGDGFARAEISPAIGTVIGKAVESFDGDTGVIEIVVGRI